MVGAATFEVEAGFDRVCVSLRVALGIMMRTRDVADSSAIGNDMAGKPPSVAQNIGQEPRVQAQGTLFIDRVVGGHDGPDMSFLDGGLELGEIGFENVTDVGIDVEAAPSGLGAAVNGKMFGAGHLLEVVGIVALNAFDEVDPHAPGEIGIFAIGFLAATPSGDRGRC